MRYEGKIFRPPSEADAYILQATIGCSWNRCTYCDMYSDKVYRERETDACLEDLRTAAAIAKNRVDKVFVGDGDALGMPTDRWLAILKAADAGFPRLRRVSCYATAINILKKTPDELAALRAAGLSRLYIGPESGDDATLKRIAKGSTFAEHVAAAERARAAGIELSVIVLLGIAGTERACEHASATARLITAMDPAFASALTTTVVPKTPLHTLQTRGRFALPSVVEMLRELRIIVDEARPTDALFRTNHASNYLAIGGRLPRDRATILATIDSAIAGEVTLRPEWARGL
ncbi:radical SAM protein [Nannocystis sp. ILAH1]|uniref:radical SAM protein n=1 Tax=unclassified Nannocystis TaxID=2627009 RepID=UPI00226D88A9|nr:MULTISPECIES: radical SAM protein [unclassified Nannocystis]MCY0991907.1 radical SAM protein [Nannocystis sp. ILAH1]MCY1064158.1 radical SAM protein [Nannocystis sp. RBIL2]